MKNKKIYFKIPVINAEYFVYVCVSNKKEGFKQVKNYFKGVKDSIKEQDFNVRGKTFLHDDFHPIIWIDISNKQIMGTVAHEATHAVTYIFNFVHQDIAQAEELFAMIVGAIVGYTEKELKG